jgi:hypothetical protein
MSDKLQEFVDKHRKEFDTEEPSKDLWNKIDSKIDGSNSAPINSKWFSKLKYFGLGASILVIAMYFVSQNLNNSSSNELAQTTKDSAMNNLGQWVKTNQSKETISETGNNVSNSTNEKNGTGNSNATMQQNGSNGLSGNDAPAVKNDSVYSKPSENSNTETAKIKDETDEILKANPVNEKKENPIVSNKSGKITIPAEPEKTNTYTGTIYDGSSLCEILRVYKFPGKVSMEQSNNYQGHRILKTTSCSKLENVPNIKAIWLKGKTSKKMTISIEEGFKNIVLVKSDGREITPEAISHYYPGLGVISGYVGKYFEMVFKDKVDLILFFKDAEEGDKIMIDKNLEAVVGKP